MKENLAKSHLLYVYIDTCYTTAVH